jgi:hypothetical protein
VNTRRRPGRGRRAHAPSHFLFYIDKSAYFDTLAGVATGFISLIEHPDETRLWLILAIMRHYEGYVIASR